MSGRQNLELKVVDKWGDLILEVGCLLRDDPSTEVGPEPRQDRGQARGRYRGQDRTDELDENASTENVPMRILVSSKVLTIGSPHHFNQENPPTVSLPEDDPQATLLFCEILHCSPGVHHFKSYKALNGLGIFADKYGCTRSLRSWFHGQLLRFDRAGHDCFDTESLLRGGISAQQMLKLCYLMNDTDMFRLASKTFYTHTCPAGIRPKLEGVYEDEVPARLIELLRASGCRYVNELSEIGPALLEHLSGEYKPFEYYTPIPRETAPKQDDGDDDRDDGDARENGLCFGYIVRSGVLGATLSSLSLLPCSDLGANSKRSPAALLRNLQRLGAINFRDDKFCCPLRSHCRCSYDSSFKPELDKKVKAAKQNARGICLGCVKDEARPVSDILQDDSPHCERHASWGE